MQLTPEHLTDLESIAIKAALRAGKMIRPKTGNSRRRRWTPRLP